MCSGSYALGKQPKMRRGSKYTASLAVEAVRRSVTPLKKKRGVLIFLIEVQFT